MSAQFGRWNFEGREPTSQYLEQVRALLNPFGPDGGAIHSQRDVTILYRAFHTTAESYREKQPHISASRAIITWDGRLDNREELTRHLSDVVSKQSADVAIVAAAYDCWHTACFPRLLGDWAVSIRTPSDRSLILAKDPIGVRHLYYAYDDCEVTWSTILDPLVLLAGKRFAICEEYIAGWFSQFPAVNVTPYVGIHSVPPASFVLLRPGICRVSKYWDFDAENSIQYKNDAEYEDHFRTAFREAVHRRLRSDRPVLAELSGGMDSSSIVCMADTIMAGKHVECPRLDTISWHDDCDPNDDDQEYFTVVERQRGRTGFHINTSTLKKGGETEDIHPPLFASEFDGNSFAAAPFPNIDPTGHTERYAEYMRSHNYRVTLSGIGGDDPTGGGVPTPIPELQNLLMLGRLLTLARRLNAWASRMKASRLSLIWDALREFLPLTLLDASKEPRPLPCFQRDFARRNGSALKGYPCRKRFFASLPSFQDSTKKLESHLRLQAQFHPRPELVREIRFPYLDRDLLEFLFAIPREQIVGIGRRRYLMKRALAGIVPDSLLKRRRLAVAHDSIKYSTEEYADFMKSMPSMFCVSLGYIDANALAEAVRRALAYELIPRQFLQRTWTLESWLRHLSQKGILANSLVNSTANEARPIETQSEECRLSHRFS
jgi:asparagine synthase (glutamine-hydrolysing)